MKRKPEVNGEDISGEPDKRRKEEEDSATTKTDEEKSEQTKMSENLARMNQLLEVDKKSPHTDRKRPEFCEACRIYNESLPKLACLHCKKSRGVNARIEEKTCARCFISHCTTCHGEISLSQLSECHVATKFDTDAEVENRESLDRMWEDKLRRPQSWHLANIRKEKAKREKSRELWKSMSHDKRPDILKLKTFVELRKANNASCVVSETKGDLFNDATNLAHCVSADFKMGAGVAKIFSEKFGGRDELLQQSVSVGEVGVLVRDGRHIFYMVTKQRYFDKPTYESLSKCLRTLAKVCLEKKITSLAMPRIGCGLDKLQWEKVRKILEDSFPSDMKINVYYLDDK